MCKSRSCFSPVRRHAHQYLYWHIVASQSIDRNRMSLGAVDFIKGLRIPLIGFISLLALFNFTSKLKFPRMRGSYENSPQITDFVKLATKLKKHNLSRQTCQADIVPFRTILLSSFDLISSSPISAYYWIDFRVLKIIRTVRLFLVVSRYMY